MHVAAQAVRDPPLLPPPKNSRWGYREKGRRVCPRTSCVIIKLFSFILACAEAAWMHPHASSPETFSLRERLSNWNLTGFLCGQLRIAGSSHPQHVSSKQRGCCGCTKKLLVSLPTHPKRRVSSLTWFSRRRRAQAQRPLACRASPPPLTCCARRWRTPTGGS